MPRSFYSVSFLNTSNEVQVSRVFSTLAAARKWAKWLGGLSYCRQVAIHLGGPDGELIPA